MVSPLTYSLTVSLLKLAPTEIQFPAVIEALVAENVMLPASNFKSAPSKYNLQPVVPFCLEAMVWLPDKTVGFIKAKTVILSVSRLAAGSIIATEFVPLKSPEKPLAPEAAWAITLTPSTAVPEAPE